MNMLTLRIRQPSPIPIESDRLTPDALAGLSVAEIERLAVRHGTRSEPLAEHFIVSGEASDGELRFEGDCGSVKEIGRGMTRGRIVVTENAGMHLGAGMSGGEIHVHGNVDSWAGAEMTDGLIHVGGNAGNLIGAAYPGARRGMRGGTILIDGSAGDEIGASMRRGLIAVGGRCGTFVGVSMIAGTIVVGSDTGMGIGSGMKRGTILLLNPTTPVELPPTFAFDCVYRPVFLALLRREWQRLGFRSGHLPELGTVRRFRGDRLTLGQGEILIPEE